MKRAFTLVEAVIVVVVLMVIAAFLFPIFARSRESGHRPSCQSNLKQIGLGMIQYTQDYDERFPPARASATTGWVDVIYPYVKSRQIFQCPQAQNPTSAAGMASDYFYNRRLARFPQSKLTFAALTIMGGDGEDNGPTWNSWSGLPSDANTNPSSPCQRHLEAGYYLFADGHVKWLKPTAISSTLESPNLRPTFAVR